AALTRTVINSAQSQGRSEWSLLLGFVLMLAGAATVFAQLQNALNRVWRVEAGPGNAIFRFLQNRLNSFRVVVAIGLVLLVSLLASALLGALQSYLDARVAGATLLWSALDMTISFTFSAVLIAAMFRFLPDAKIDWRDSWLGAIVTSVLLVLGKNLI